MFIQQVLPNASVVDNTTNLTVVAIEFKLNKNGILLCITCATLYNWVPYKPSLMDMSTNNQ